MCEIDYFRFVRELLRGSSADEPQGQDMDGSIVPLVP